MAGKISIEEKLKEATRYKEMGNELYKMKDYRAAAVKYHRSIIYLKGIDNDLHGTPAYLQAVSVNPDQANCISKQMEQECIQLNIQGRSGSLYFHFFPFEHKNATSKGKLFLSVLVLNAKN